MKNKLTVMISWELTTLPIEEFVSDDMTVNEIFRPIFYRPNINITIIMKRHLSSGDLEQRCQICVTYISSDALQFTTE